MNKYLTQACHGSWEAVILFTVKIHKMELSCVDDECQQFILKENLLSVSDLVRGRYLSSQRARGQFTPFASVQNTPLARTNLLMNAV